MQASAPTPAGLRVGRPKTWGRSGGSRRTTWDTKPTGSLPTLLLLLRLPPPRPTSLNSWRTSSANRHQTTPLTASRLAERGAGVQLSLYLSESERWALCADSSLLFLGDEVSLGLRFLPAFLPEPQWLHHEFMRAESLARGQWKKTKASFQFAFHKMTGSTTLTGSRYPADDIKKKTTLIAQPERSRWHGTEPLDQSLNHLERHAAEAKIAASLSIWARCTFLSCESWLTE